MTTLQTLSTELFLGMMKSGARNIIENEALLNELNVYPVRDHDTGSNMASLMRYILAQKYKTDNVSSLLKQLKDASLLGSCGNSGMIFSSFVAGFASTEQSLATAAFSMDDFASCLEQGKKQAYLSVANPTEGTMLSVISAWYEACRDASNDFISLFEKSMASAAGALRQTEFQLSVLKKNHVIDAGAYGFYLFIQGMRNYLVYRENADVEAVDLDFEIALPEENDFHAHEEQSAYCYCMENLVIAKDVDIDAIKSQITALGDSIVINCNDEHMKVHVHTDDVQAITSILKTTGSIQYQKIENMKTQWAATHARKYPIALVTDSSADIPEEWINSEQIHVLPLQVRIGEHNLLDRLTSDLHDMYATLNEKKVRANTASPSPEMVTRYLRFLANNYQSVIAITLTSQSSSTHQIFSKQAATIHSKPITVIDSKCGTVAQGLLVMHAAKMIAAGLDHQTIVNRLNEMREDTDAFVAVNEFNTLVQSGRVPKVLGILSSWSHFKPIVHFGRDGKPAIAGLAIGQAMCWRKIAKLVNKAKQKSGVLSAAVVHSAAPELAKRFAEYMTKKTGVQIDFIKEVSCSAGLQSGQGCVAIAVNPEKLN